MTEYSGEQHEPENELDDDKEQLAFGAWFQDATGGGQRQRAQVKTLQVLTYAIIGISRLTHPDAIIAYERRIETIVAHDDAIETSVPVENDQKIMDETDGAEHVRIVGVSLRPVHKRPEAIDLDKPEAAQHGIETDGQVEEVKR